MDSMDRQRTPMDPADAARAFAGRLAEAGLPCFAFAAHDVDLDLLMVTWTHGVTLYMDLTREGFLEPIDAHGRAVRCSLSRRRRPAAGRVGVGRDMSRSRRACGRARRCT